MFFKVLLEKNEFTLSRSLLVKFHKNNKLFCFLLNVAEYRNSNFVTFQRTFLVMKLLRRMVNSMDIKFDILGTVKVK